MKKKVKKKVKRKKRRKKKKPLVFDPPGDLRPYPK